MILQNSDFGTQVFTINATDRDAGVNAIIRYSLDDMSNSFPFTLVGDIIRVDGNLDFEQQNIYSVRLPPSLAQYAA